MPETLNRTVGDAKQVLLARRSPHYWRITLDHPPLNIFGPDTIPQLNEVITALETDKQVKVVVFDSAVEGFFLTHYDFVAKLEDPFQQVRDGCRWLEQVFRESPR